MIRTKENIIPVLLWNYFLLNLASHFLLIKNTFILQYFMLMQSSIKYFPELLYCQVQ